MSYRGVCEKEKTIVQNNQYIASTPHPRINYKGVVCKKPWGHEFLIYESSRIGIWFLKIEAGHKTSLHTHFHKDTLLFCISGAAKLAYIDGEEEELNVLEWTYIPKHTFHGIGSFATETWLLEIEIYDEKATFSDKNDLLRMDDQYKRDVTGYEASVQVLKEDLEAFEHFELYDGFAKEVQKVGMRVITLSQETMPLFYAADRVVLLSGSVGFNGMTLREGSLIPCEPTVWTDARVLLMQRIDSAEDAKILHTMDQVALRAKKVKSEGKSIVLTSGCFDILHVGHLQNLKNAKKEGDLLWVCLSNDAQIQALKGTTRPINKMQDRIDLFKTIQYVDAIIPYNEEGLEKEETLDLIMKLVDPDVWVKGSDYTKGAIYAKHPYLKKVVLLPNVQDKSTTRIIQKIIGEA